MNNKPYVLSFVGGALLYKASLIVAEEYLKFEDWTQVRNKVINENLLQARTQSTLKRIYSELSQRLKKLNNQELSYLAKATNQEQAYILWLAICRRYTYIADFAAEVLHDNYITYKPQVTFDDYQAFYLTKAEYRQELVTITQLTQQKIRQILFKMLREVGLIDTKNYILAAKFTADFKNLLAKKNYQEAVYFPIIDNELYKL